MSFYCLSSFSFFVVCLNIFLSSSTGLWFALSFFLLFPRPIVRCIVLGDFFIRLGGRDDGGADEPKWAGAAVAGAISTCN